MISWIICFVKQEFHCWHILLNLMHQSFCIVKRPSLLVLVRAFFSLTNPDSVTRGFRAVGDDMPEPPGARSSRQSPSPSWGLFDGNELIFWSRQIIILSYPYLLFLFLEKKKVRISLFKSHYKLSLPLLCPNVLSGFYFSRIHRFPICPASRAASPLTLTLTRRHWSCRFTSHWPGRSTWGSHGSPRANPRLQWLSMGSCMENTHWLPREKAHPIRFYSTNRERSTASSSGPSTMMQFTITVAAGKARSSIWRLHPPSFRSPSL